MSDSGTGLLVGCIGVSHGHDNTGLARGLNTGNGAEQFWSDCEDAGVSGSCMEKFLE